VTYEPWHARVGLSSAYEPNDAKRFADLRLVIQHIAHHRGWRNPWWHFERLALEFKEDSSPTAEFEVVRERAAKLLGLSPDELTTVGQIGWAASNPKFALRPRHLDMSTQAAKNRQTSDNIIVDRLMQQDLLRELTQILHTQQISSPESDKICSLVFKAAKASVPSENVGKDPFSKTELRAPKSSLEFQEFRIRDTIANLRIASTKSPLSEEQRQMVVARLLTWEEGAAPTWADVSDWLGLLEQDLKFASSDTARASKAPINVTHNKIVRLSEVGDKQKRLAGQHIQKWYADATPRVQREFCAFLGDSTDAGNDDELEALMEHLGEEEFAILDSLDQLSGRAAYSRGTLARLNSAMATGLDLNGALMKEFHQVSGWKPLAEPIFAQVDHPVVDRVMTDVGRWLDAITTKHGAPERVNVEHVRSAFLGPEAKEEYNSETNRRRKQNEADTKAISEELNIDVKTTDPRRYRAIQMQGCACLYCGEVIGYTTCEMDHIVPRAVGGSNRRDNLVAVCQRCNRSKNAEPFANWAADVDFVSIEDSVERVKMWQRPQGTRALEFGRFKKQVTFRLKRTELDDEIDERSLASTAYAAVTVRERVQGFLELKFANPASGEVGQIPVNVYRGALTAASRKAAGIDRRIKLLGFDAETHAPGKSRFDRRHHAVDAATVAMISPGIAQTMGQRVELRGFDRPGTSSQVPSWKRYEGKSSETFESWVSMVQNMADLLNTEIERDRIVVMRPLRLGANVGKIHDDTVQALVRKNLREGLSAQEVNRIADRDVWRVVRNLTTGAGDLPEKVNDPTLAKLLTDETVGLFPKKSAMLAVRNGAVAIGSTLHHVRVYRRDDGPGKPAKFSQIRVFAGEFGTLGWRKKGVNLFTEPLPNWSEAIRCGDLKLQQEIENGSASLIGWLVPGDEIEFAPGDAILPVIEPIEGVTSSPLTENRWVITGFESDSTINLAPAYLAREGIKDQDSVPPVLDGKFWRAAINKVMRARPTIIRRSATGIPRWHDLRDGLPISWKVLPDSSPALEPR
jgi:CRISPR-associated endonuclease Csn1